VKLTMENVGNEFNYEQTRRTESGRFRAKGREKSGGNNSTSRFRRSRSVEIPNSHSETRPRQSSTGRERFEEIPMRSYAHSTDQRNRSVDEDMAAIIANQNTSYRSSSNSNRHIPIGQTGSEQSHIVPSKESFATHSKSERHIKEYQNSWNPVEQEVSFHGMYDTNIKEKERETARSIGHAPDSGMSTSSRSFIPRPLNSDHIAQLQMQGFSRGLARALAENAQMFDHRIWVVDNSGSMQLDDGHRVVDITKSSKNGGRGTKKYKIVPSSRWEEIQDTVKYHAQMAALLDSTTVFRLLNDPGTRVGQQQFSVAERGGAEAESEIKNALEIMQKTRPDGVTPLTQHIWDIYDSMEQMTDQLKEEGKKVVVVLATDGLPTDESGCGGESVTEDFIDALRALEGLPVWLVVRLCSDEESVTSFYNELDSQLELSLEVIDDFVGESREVFEHNPWLNYALPMHRIRELGYHDRLFDLIDERALTKGELRSFCSILFGEDEVKTLVDPAIDWIGFIKSLQTLLSYEKAQWNPIKNKILPWIDLKVLNKIYGDKGDCAIM